MSKENIELTLLKKIRLLSYILIVSGGLNIGLLFTFFYSVAQQKQHVFDHEISYIKKEKTPPIQGFSNTQKLSEMYFLSYRELITLLSDKQPIEEGYLKRDLALGCLVSFYHFDLDKALLKQPIQKRRVVFSHNKQKKIIYLFPGLTDYHFDGIIHYALTEKWPLTSKGLFTLLHHSKQPWDKTLEQACQVSKEFHLVQTLFSLSGGFVSSEELLSLLSQISWELLDNFSYEQSQIQDLSPDRRRTFLLSCLEERSSQSAYLLLKTDLLYVIKKCSNNQILAILELLTEQNDETEQFCVELLKSRRSDEVWHVSAKKLYSFYNETCSFPYNHQQALQRFVYTDQLKDKWSQEEQEPKKLKTILFSSIEKRKNYHLVKKGDSLWKIARMYKIEMEEIVRLNNLKTDCIFPGTKIYLPKKD